MRIKHKYLRNKRHKSKLYRRFKKVYRYLKSWYDPFYSSYEEALKNHEEFIQKCIRNADKGYWGCNNAPKDFRQDLNRQLRTKNKMNLIHDREFIPFKRNANWLYF